MESSKIAEYLLKIKAVKLSLDPPFMWSSGWQSPIYCDNRLLLSYPEIRTYVKSAFVDIIRRKYPETEGIAGVATGAIAHGALVAEAMDLPLVYIRSKAKGHGLQNRIEGDVHQAGKYVVLEDLVSTGKSSVSAVRALQDAGVEVLGTVSIFSYGFAEADHNYAASGTTYQSLVTLPELLVSAEESQYVDQKGMAAIKNWQKDPANWKP